MKTTSLKSLLCLAALALTGSFAQAATIGVQFNASGTALTSSQIAGVPAVQNDNWNSLSGSSFSSVVLNNDSGVATTATLTTGTAAGPALFVGTYNQNGASGFDAANLTLSAGQIYVGGGYASLDIANIPFTTYDLYVYGRNDNNSVASVFTVGSQSFSFTTQQDGPWVLGTNTWNGVGTRPTLAQANYVVFTGLTASSINLLWSGRNATGDGYAGNSPINGFQIVDAVPEPTTAALLGMSLGAVMLLRRRRTAA